MKSIICTSILKILQSLRAFGANIWNTLPEYIKSTTSSSEFKNSLKRGQDQNTNAEYANENETSF